MSSRIPLPPPGELHFSYILNGHGWAQATIADSSRRARMTASYLSDALGNLLEAVNAIASGAERATCVWDEEPGEYRWQFLRRGGSVSIDIYAADFPTEIDDGEDEAELPPTLVFQTTVTTQQLAGSIEGAAEKLLSLYGESGYEAKWALYPYPTRSLRRLQSLIASMSENGG